MTELVVVYAGDAVKARIAWSALRGRGIAAELYDQHLGTIYSSAGAGIGVKVVVAAADVSAARDVLIAERLMTPGDEA